MPSVQWGATNTAKLIFTPISSALANLPNGAGTIAILWKPGDWNADGAGLTNSAQNNWYHAHGVNGGQWYDDDGISATVSVSGRNPTNKWYATVVDWPSGGSPALERFHSIDLTAAGSWAHENSAGKWRQQGRAYYKWVVSHSQSDVFLLVVSAAAPESPNRTPAQTATRAIWEPFGT